MRQFFLDLATDATPPEPGDDWFLDAEESRHLLRVLRARPGDPVLLTDGRGGRYRALLVRDEGGRARLRIEAREDDAVELRAPRLVLACGLIKGKRWEALLETAVELGVHAVAPLLTRRAEVDPGSGRRRRWRTVLRTALKQSGRSWCPGLEEPCGLEEFLASRPRAEVYYGLARDRDRTAGQEGLLTPGTCAVGDGPVPEELVWCVGPEGGWEDDEVALLSRRGRAVRLGPHRLRTATAAAAGLLLLSARREELSAGTGPGPAERA